MSDNKEIHTLLPSVLMQVPGCPEVVAADAMGKAIRDWYRDTFCWKEALPSFETNEATSAYILTPPVCTKIIALEGVYNDGRLIDNNEYTMELPRKLLFSKPPKPNMQLTPIAVLSTSNGSDSVKCDHAAQWLDDWAHGALWYLQMQAAQPWYNPNEAERNRQLFRSAIANQRIQQNTSHRVGDLRARNKLFI